MYVIAPSPVRSRALLVKTGLVALFIACIVALVATISPVQPAHADDTSGGTLTTSPTSAADDIASGTQEGITWTISADGVLTIAPTDGISGEYGDNLRPWDSYRLQIKEVVVEDGVIAPRSMRGMFENMQALTAADIRGFDTSNTTDMAYLFGGSTNSTNNYMLQSVNMAGLDTSNVTDFSYMFSRAYHLTSLNISGMDTSSATNMNAMFANLRRIESLDVSSFDTSNVTDMSVMFADCRALTELDVSGFDTSNVTTFTSMFRRCHLLESLNVSNFNTSSANSMTMMFGKCISLTTLDLRSFDTSNVTHFNYMFTECSSLTELDLSSFSTASGEAYGDMFTDATFLERLVLGPDFNMSGEGASKAGLAGSWYLEGTSDDTAVTGSQFLSAYDGSQPGAYVRSPETDIESPDVGYIFVGTSFYEVHSPNATESAYCINRQQNSAIFASYYKELATEEAILACIGENYGCAPLGDTMLQALTALVYYNAPQSYMWYFTNWYREDGGNPVIEAWAAEHTYASIPNAQNLRLYLYRNNYGYQTMVALAGLTDQPLGGVEIAKTNEKGQRLVGAKLGIYDEADNLVCELSTGATGYAGIYRMDNVEGLPLGTYTVRELAAPKNYLVTDDYLTFTISEDQQFVKVGKLNGQGEDVALALVDPKDYKKPKPVTVEIEKYLKDALIHDSEFSFGLYDESGKLVDTITTALGTKTGEDEHTSVVTIAFKGLEFSEVGTYNYTIREHMNGTTEVVEGDELNQQGFEPGFYKGGVKYDDKEYRVVVDVKESANDEFQLEAAVSYPDSEDGIHLYNEYSEEYVDIDGNDDHVNDGRHSDEPGKENDESGKKSSTSTKTPVKGKTPSSGKSPSTADTNPVAPLSALALAALALGTLAAYRVRSR